MNTEALLWLGVILSSPVIYMLSKMFFTWLLDLFFCDETVVITLKDKNGNVEKKTISLDKSDDLIKLMRDVKEANGMRSRRAKEI